MKGKRWIMRIFGLRIWEITPFFRKLRCYCYSKLLKLDNIVSVHSYVMITAHHKLKEGENRNSFSVGKNCILNDYVNIDITGKVIIGNDVVFAEEVIVYTHKHDVPNKPKLHTESTCLKIADGAFIGARAIILSSCHYIGANARIGAGAVVTKDIPDNSVAVGVPAKIITTYAN